MAFGKFRQGLLGNLLGARHRHPACGDRSQRRGPAAVLQQGTFAEDGARTDLGKRVAVDLHGEDAVEQQKQVIAGLALLNQRSPGLDLCGSPAWLHRA